MSDRMLSLASDPDDLPRTLRRERDARERATQAAQYQNWPDMPQAATVTGVNIPFFRLMFFCFKVVVAGIPALALLCVLLWGGMTVLKTYYPDLIHARIYIDFNPPAPPVAKAAVPVPAKNIPAVR